VAGAPQIENDLESDLHTNHQILNMGPSHPATHGTVKFLIELDGETVVNLDVQVGYLHRGFEKECESGSWYQCIPYTDRPGKPAPPRAPPGACRPRRRPRAALAGAVWHRAR
jgi:NADH:ubiquinone oxidoreductase subunit D